MKIRIAVLAFALVATGAFAAPDAAKTAEKEKKLATLLVDKLGKDAETIKVAIVDGKVVMTGQVADRATEELAPEVVKYADPKAKIDYQVKATTENSLTGGKAGDEIADNKLEGKVRGKVKDELGAHYKPVYIECTAGTCSVRGTVPDQARKDLALKTAGGVEGVKRVIDLLRVKG